jgi:hypothetical protein
VTGEDQARRIFICYPRSALKQVMRFHEALAEGLAVRGRTYEVFRDKGDGERIEPGEDWNDVLQRKLKTSVCCVVAMVPAIFESVECRKEIETFRGYIKSDPRRFFYPLDFVEVQSSVQAYAERGDETARLMQSIDRQDFTKAVHEPNQTIYEQQVDAIAKAIHRRIEARTDEGPPPDGPPKKPRKRWPSAVAPSALVAILAVVLAWLWLRPPEPGLPLEIAVGEPLDIAFDLVLPVRLKLLPEPNAPDAAESVGPGALKSGVANVSAIRQVVGKPTWYRLDLAGEPKGYLDKTRVPDWADIDPGIELYRKLPARPLPLASRDPDPKLALEPDSLAPLRKRFGAPRIGTIDSLRWYRIRRSATSEVFLSGDDTRDALATWAAYAGCLMAAKSVKSQTAIVDGQEGQSFSGGDVLAGPFQSAEVRGQTWVRFPRGQDVYGYIRFADLERCP